MLKDIVSGIGISIGFDAILDAFTSLDESFKNSANYPPFKIKKISNNRFDVEVNVAGYSQDDIVISIDDMVLKVKTKSSKKQSFFENRPSDDEYMVFLLSRAFHLDQTSVKDGILYMSFINTFKEHRKITIDFSKDKQLLAVDAVDTIVSPTKVVVAVEKDESTPLTIEVSKAPEPKPLPVVEVVPEPVTYIVPPEPVVVPVEPVKVVEELVVSEPVQMEVKEPVVIEEVVSEPVVAAEVLEPVVVNEPVVEDVKPEPVTIIEPIPLLVVGRSLDSEPVLINTEDNTKPTIAVAVPDEVTPVMEAVVEVSPLINTISDQPQITVQLVPVEDVKPSEEVVAVPTISMETADIAVVVKPEVVEALSQAEVKLEEVVAEAIEQAQPILPKVEDEHPVVSELEPVSVTEEVSVVPTISDVPESVQQISEPIVEMDQPVVEVVSQETSPTEQTVIPEVLQDQPSELVVEVPEKVEEVIENYPSVVSEEVSLPVEQPSVEPIVENSVETLSLDRLSSELQKPVVEVEIPVVVNEVPSVSEPDVDPVLPESQELTLSEVPAEVPSPQVESVQPSIDLIPQVDSSQSSLLTPEVLEIPLEQDNVVVNVTEEKAPEPVVQEPEIEPTKIVTLEPEVNHESVHQDAVVQEPVVVPVVEPQMPLPTVVENTSLQDEQEPLPEENLPVATPEPVAQPVEVQPASEVVSVDPLPIVPDVQVHELEPVVAVAVEDIPHEEQAHDVAQEPELSAIEPQAQNTEPVVLEVVPENSASEISFVVDNPISETNVEVKEEEKVSEPVAVVEELKVEQPTVVEEVKVEVPVEPSVPVEPVVPQIEPVVAQFEIKVEEPVVAEVPTEQVVPKVIAEDAIVSFDVPVVPPELSVPSEPIVEEPVPVPVIEEVKVEVPVEPVPVPVEEVKPEANSTPV